MNHTASLKDRLDRAKRDVEKRIDLVKNFVRPYDPSRGDGVVSDFLYTYPSITQVHTTWKRRWLAARPELAPQLTSTTHIDQLVQDVLNAGTLALELKGERDREIAAKRAGVKAKVDLKTRLNLQEGVKLQGVDVGQYEVILAGLEPVRLHAQASRREQLASLFIAIKRKLNDHGGRVELAYPDANNPRYGKAPKFFNEFFREISNSVGREYEERPSNERSEFIRKESARFALAYVQGYAVKLALKTGEVIANTKPLARFGPVSCEVSSTNLWDDSVAVIGLRSKSGAEDFTTIKFKTQMIWNQSVYGLQFNQFPTRRID